MGALRAREGSVLDRMHRVWRRYPALVLVSAFVLVAHAATAAELGAAPHTTNSALASRAQTLESLHRPLADAQLHQRLTPGVESERALAQEYAKLGVSDTAFDHFEAALHFNPRDAASYEGIARIWRDWGFPGRGLASAYRAVFWAPQSASAHNTLGTLLAKLGYADAARERFNRALQLDPSSAYPLNNLCYLELGQHNPGLAVRYCAAALQLEPAAATTRNNLALALTTAGRLEDALAVFDEGPATALTAYNKGMLLLAAGRVDSARDSFAEARIADPSFAPARIRLARLAVTRKEP